MTEFKETDLYEPIRAFLEEEGYQVQAEVKHCDIAAEKNGRLVVVELKRAFGLKLVYQGLERQSLTDEVFVAIPRPKKGAREKAWQDMLRLLKRLELGLLLLFGLPSGLGRHGILRHECLPSFKWYLPFLSPVW